MRLHLHLLSDSTGETLENIAKAALAQFDDVDTMRHFWPMVRSETHLERILAEITVNPGLVLYTLVNPAIRRMLEARCAALGLPIVAPMDAVSNALSSLLGQEAKARPGRQHSLDAAYFARVDAIQWTIAHDDGIASEDWEEADIVLAACRVRRRRRRRSISPIAGSRPRTFRSWSKARRRRSCSRLKSRWSSG